MGTKNILESGPNSFVFLGIKNMSRVNLMATVLCWHCYDNRSKLVFAGEIQKWNYRMEMTTYFSKQKVKICKSRRAGALQSVVVVLLYQ